MNKIKTVEGNLLQMAANGAFDVIVHGCNCFHNMGGGIAAQIAKIYPEAAEVDLQTDYGDALKLGTFSTAIIERDKEKPGNSFAIINAYTQYRGGTVECERELYLAIRCAFRGIFAQIPSDGTGVIGNYDWPIRIGIPKIGCGIAGGNWDIVNMIITEEFEKSSDSWELELTVVEFKP